MAFNKIRLQLIAEFSRRNQIRKLALFRQPFGRILAFGTANLLTDSSIR